MKLKWWNQKRYQWAILGCLLSFVGPAMEWLFLSLWTTTASPWGANYIFTELWTLLLFACIGYLLGKSTDKVEYIAFHDALTGVFNRGYLMEKFKQKFPS